MKKTGAYFWAGLDILTFMRNLLYITNTLNLGFSGLSSEGIFNVVTRDLLLISLLFSAFFTVRQKKLGAWVYWGQLPVRYYFYLFSFSSLRDLPFLEVFENGPEIIFWLLVTFELLRIAYTVRYFHEFYPVIKKRKSSAELLDA